ncbi:cellulase family glycosylhydrolase [Ruminiclostridium herbifermentans]|uniref:cellulase n=1 Tax=Ruminiclostridium herbifermentans TaxID=2488810 RepID=A0A4U7JLK2_9FIRM|nr:cellulase family glycosylhydrolase [Ruminiclostridium herbifermentans]QNU66059.1 cellulase family glycosylhydrolase [Ruminiclostridium herbifermentans]
MKKKTKKFISLSLAALTAFSLLLAPAKPVYVEAAVEAEANDDWLHVEGTNIVDKYGNKVWLTGANWFGFNCRERMLLDSYHSNIVADIQMVADKGINVVRMPIATDLLYAWSKGEYPPSTDTSYNNADLAGLNSFELFNFMLENFKKVGIKVILDVHSAETDNQGHNYPLWFKGAITEKVFKDAWVWVANHYKNDDTIIGFDLKNEPHTNSGDLKIMSESAIWDNSNRPTNWKRVAQETALAILEVHPNALIFVEGVEIYPKDGIWDDETTNTSPWTGNDDYYGNWWGGNLRGVKDYPIDLGKHQKQLVYSPHDYGPLVFEQSWFKGEFVTADDAKAKKILYEQCWRDNWAYIMEDGISPLLLGEWGGLTEGNDKLLDLNLKYLRSMRDYILENKYKLHHTLWCINIDSADTGGLFTRGEGTPFEGGRDLKWNDNKYDNYLLPVLWKNADGKFQGLDHKIPLGRNGVPLGTTPIDDEDDDEDTVKYGDVNNDGDINALDIAALKMYLLGVNQSIDLKAADVNVDNSVDAIDFALLKKYLLGAATLPVK